MRCSLFWVWFLPLLASTACSPYIRYGDHSAEAWGFSGRCGQGPFVLRTTTLGTRWGERLSIRGSVNHAVSGRFRARVGNDPPSQGVFSTVQQVVQPNGTSTNFRPPPQNERCIQRPVEVVEAAPDPRPAPPEQWSMPTPAPAPAPPPVDARPPPLDLPPAPEPPPVAMPATQLVRLGPLEATAEVWMSLTFTSWTWGAKDEIGTPAMAPGTPVELELWSDEPMDWERARIEVVHEVAFPSVPETEYIAWLHKERREAEEDAKRRTAEWTAKRDKRARHCEEDHDDEDCWGQGGYNGWLARQRAPRPRPPPTVAPAPAPVVAQVVPAAPEPPRPTQPPGPPPAPQDELAPPQPSTHAEWVSGFWKWSGFVWVWLGGWWRVPEADLRAQLTVIAPGPPPPLQAEPAPPPPVPDAVWLAGAWFWTGQTWLWHRGQWTLPPRQGLLWRPAQWILQGAGVRLTPGGWELRSLPLNHH